MVSKALIILLLMSPYLAILTLGIVLILSHMTCVNQSDEIHFGTLDRSSCLCTLHFDPCSQVIAVEGINNYNGVLTPSTIYDEVRLQVYGLLICLAICLH